MLRLAFIYNPKKSHTLDAAHHWAERMTQFGVTTPPVVSAFDDQAIADVLTSVELIITLGGDGTLVRLARLAAPYRLPVLGVQYGRVGFLSEVKPDEFEAQAQAIVEKRFWVEERVMLRATHQRGNQILREIESVNDVVVSRARPARVIYVTACIDEGCISEFACDGVIVATATGSTAYSFACGGPILPPTHLSYLLTVIAPYLNPIRSVVIPSHATVTLHLESSLEASLTIDGQDDFDFAQNDTVVIKRSAQVARFARLGSQNYFFESLRARLSGVET